MMQHSFDLVAVGSGGGPHETNLSGYLLKAADTKWEQGIVALEAGSGVGMLSVLLERNPKLFDDLEPLWEGNHVHSRFLAAQVYSYVQTFLITHGHLDHIMSLVISAGSLPPPPPLQLSPESTPLTRRRIVGLKPILDDVSMVFGGKIWPNLASWSQDPTTPNYLYLYDTIPAYHPVSPTPPGSPKKKPSLPNQPPFQSLQPPHTISTPAYSPLNPSLSVLGMPVCHGSTPHEQKDAQGDPNSSYVPYTSSAFFIKHLSTNRQFLFFGDVEPDSIALLPATRPVWAHAAPLIVNGTLNSIFLECSWEKDRKDGELYGHLNPHHILAEMKALATEVVWSRDPTLKPVTSNGDHTVKRMKSQKNMVTRAIHKFRSNGKKKSIDGQPKSPMVESLPAPITPPPPMTTNVVTLDSQHLKGSLQGVRLYIIHCKEPLLQSQTSDPSRPIAHVVAKQVQEFIDLEELGVEVIPVDQGMRLKF